MADKVTKADYEALTDAAKSFSQESDRIKQIAGRLGRGAENLKRTSWTGKGADAFFKEVETSILPTYRRLSDALKEASNIMKALGQLFQGAEEEASATIKGTGGGSALGGGADAGEGGGLLGSIGSMVGAAMGGQGAAGGGGIGDAIAAALGGAFGGLSLPGADAGSKDAGDLESFPGTLQEALQNALGGAGLKPSGNIIEIVLKKGEGMADTGQQYGVDQPSAGGGAGGGEPVAAPTEPQSTGGGGSGGGSDSGGSGGGGQGGGASMVEGGSVGTPLGAGQGFWFGATPGSRLSSAGAALSAVGISPSAPAAGGNALGLLASLGASAGAAALGVVGKAVLGKGFKP